MTQATATSSIADTHWEETLTGAMLLCSLVGRAFYQYPDRAWIESLITEHVFAEAPFAAQQPDVIRGTELLTAWSAAHDSGLSDEDFEQLTFDYNHLFIGPHQVLCPPWESVHFSADRLVFQKETLNVREWYGRFGLQVTNLKRDPDDHIGLELEFVAQLNRLALEAVQDGDAVRLDELLGAQRQFLAEHPLRWAAKWCHSVVKQARTEFYSGLAMITLGALAELAAILDSDSGGQ